MSSCTQKPETTPTDTSATVITPAETAPVETAAKPEGLALIEGADCLSCHKTDAKLIGPSYQEIANKYTAADTDVLAEKIIKGGKGNWGDIEMTAHPAISTDDAKKMVAYILTIEKIEIRFQKSDFLNLLRKNTTFVNFSPGW